MKCLNCDTEFEGNFCPHCGQKRMTNRFTTQKLLTDAVLTISNTDSGFLSNLKNLTLQPGSTINNYLDGKRKKIYNPFSYVIIAIGLFIFIDHYIDFSLFSFYDNPDLDKKELPKKGLYGASYKAGYFLHKYLKFLYPINVIYLSLMTWLILRKRNFVEYLVSNSFIIGHAILLTIITIPLFKFPIVFNPITLIFIGILMYKTYKTYEEKIVVLITVFFGILVMCILQFIVPIVVILVKDAIIL